MMQDNVNGGVDYDPERDADMLSACVDKVVNGFGKSMQEWCYLPYTSYSVLDRYVSLAIHIRARASSFVVLGIGGSALGTIAVSHALSGTYANLADGMKFFVEDNIDPERMESLLSVIDLSSTYFNVVTKSGETSETASQFFILYRMVYDKIGERANSRFIITTTLGSGSLYEFAVAHNMTVFGIGEGVGGRFSVLSSVGLFPLAVLGADIRRLLAGARNACGKCLSPYINQNMALTIAYLQYLAYKDGKPIQVLMPYAESMRYFSDFYCQLIGESLGKRKDGEYVGFTPVRAMGVTDQHSQLQLYMDGPLDKVVTFFAVQNYRSDFMVSGGSGKLEYLSGHSLGKIMNTERISIAQALRDADRINMTVVLDRVDEYTLGELITVMMYATAFAAGMLGVDAFDQPGVEAGKRKMRQLLSDNKQVHADRKFIIEY